jgi:hypothetical protein
VRNLALRTEVDAMAADRARIEQLSKRLRRAARQARRRWWAAKKGQGHLHAAAAAEAAALPLFKEAQSMAQLMQPELAAAVLTDKLEPVQKQWQGALKGLAELSELERAHALEAAARRAGRPWSRWW